MKTEHSLCLIALFIRRWLLKPSSHGCQYAANVWGPDDAAADAAVATVCSPESGQGHAAKPAASVLAGECDYQRTCREGYAAVSSNYAYLHTFTDALPHSVTNALLSHPNNPEQVRIADFCLSFERETFLKAPNKVSWRQKLAILFIWLHLLTWLNRSPTMLACKVKRPSSFKNAKRTSRCCKII